MIEDGTLLGCGHAADGVVGYSVLGSLGGKTLCRPCNDQRLRDNYKPVTLRRERVSIAEHMGLSTSVGTIPWPADLKRKRETGSPFPMSHGNCCNILNMCSENAGHIIKIMPDVAKDCEAEIVQLGERERVRIVDERIPEGYLHHDCNTCGVYEGR